MVNLLLLIIKVILCLDVPKQVLERTNHVTVETNANHFNKYLVQVLNRRVPLDITVAHRRE